MPALQRTSDQTPHTVNSCIAQDIDDKDLFLCLILIILLHCKIPSSYTSIKALGKQSCFCLSDVLIPPVDFAVVGNFASIAAPARLVKGR